MADRISDPIGRLMGLRYKSHPWHGVSIGDDAPKELTAFIEVVSTDTVKYEIDKDSDCLMVDRFMTAPMFYPANYGYINNTLADDGDAVDVLVITPHPIAIGSVIRCRPVGVLNMTDEAGEDAKLVAVPHDKLTKEYSGVQDIEDIPQLLRDQIKHFFENYKTLEPNKWVKVEGWSDAAAARSAIEAGAKAYEAAK